MKELDTPQVIFHMKHRNHEPSANIVRFNQMLDLSAKTLKKKMFNW